MRTRVIVTAVAVTMYLLPLTQPASAGDTAVGSHPNSALLTAKAKGVDQDRYREGIAQVHQGMQAGDQAAVNANFLGLLELLASTRAAESDPSTTGTITQWTNTSDERSRTSF